MRKRLAARYCACLKPAPNEVAPDLLAKKFAMTSVDVVRNQPGNQGHFFGKSVSDEDDVFLFVSVWRDLNAVKTRFGDDWESSFLPPGYSDLIEECSVKHFALRMRPWAGKEAIGLIIG